MDAAKFWRRVSGFAVMTALAALAINSDTALAKRGHGHGHHHHHHGHHHHGHGGFHWGWGGPSISLRFGSPAPVYVPPPVIYRPAPVFVAPPIGYTVISIGGVKYYERSGVYYRPYWQDGRTVYLPADPPGIALAVPADRPGIALAAEETPSTTLPWNAASLEAPTLAPPALPSPGDATPAPASDTTGPAVGTTVDRLPIGATVVESGGTQYYQLGDTFYLPIQVDGAIRFVVVNRP